MSVQWRCAWRVRRRRRHRRFLKSEASPSRVKIVTGSTTTTVCTLRLYCTRIDVSTVHQTNRSCRSHPVTDSRYRCVADKLDRLLGTMLSYLDCVSPFGHHFYAEVNFISTVWTQLFYLTQMLCNVGAIFVLFVGTFDGISRSIKLPC